jgi:sulfofructose kinase
MGQSASEVSVTFVGAATLDGIALVPQFPQPDERLVAEEIAYAGGGPAATAAVAAARLGVAAGFVGAVGDDAEGKQIVDGLLDEGVDISGMTVVSGRRSGASIVVVDRGRGTRAICNRPVPRPELSAEATARILDAEWVHVDHVGWAPVSDLLARAGRRPRLSVDGGNPIPGFTPKDVDLYAPTLDALVREYGEQRPEELLAAALAAGARCVVATRGAEGSLAATRDGERYEAAGFPTEVLSTLGAGDVFHGALLAALLRGLPLPACLSYANVVAALSCRGLDGRSAIPTHVEATRHVPALAS